MVKRIYIILVLSWFVTYVSFATTYYVSATGDDSNSGTSSKRPWKTLGKVNSLSPLPGDRILFKRGDVWIGTVKVNSSGTENKPIVFGAYGSGEKPVISGLVPLSQWECAGDGIYKSGVLCNKEVNLLVINDRSHYVGRYPNDGYIKYEKVDSLNSLYAPKLTSDFDWNGSEMVLKNNNWTISRNQIINHSNSRIDYMAGTHYIPRLGDDYGFFIQRSIHTLDRFGEWYYDGSHMFVFFGTNEPYDYHVQTSSVDTLMNINNQHNIVIENLLFRGSDKLSVFCRKSDNFIIRSCDIELSGTDAIRLQESCRNAIIQDNKIIQTNGLAIEVGRTENVKIIGNVINNTGLNPGMGRPGSGYQAISLFSKNAEVSENVIDSAGYNGISFYIDYTGSSVKNNLIKHTNQLITDGSAIYMWEVNSQIISDNSGIDITNNIILNCGSNGIYSDGYVNNVRMKSNTIAFGAKGIHMNQPRYNIIEDNILYKNSNRAISMQNLAEAQILINASKNTIRENLFVGNSNTGDKIFQLADGKSDSILSFGESESNLIFIPSPDYIGVEYSIKDHSNLPLRESLTIHEWKDKHEFDRHSKTVVYEADDLFFEYNASNKKKRIQLPFPMFDVEGKSYKNTITIEPYTSVVLLKNKMKAYDNHNIK